MVKILGIEFAPLFIPLERRIQTLCTLHFVTTFLMGGFGCLALAIYLLFTRYYLVTLLYMMWYYFDKDTSEKGGRPISWIRYLPVWKKMAAYFPAKLHKTVDLDAKKSYIFGIHPHGIFQTSGFLSFATEGTGFSKLFPGLTPHLLVLAGQFQFPFYRDYFLSSGAASVSKKSFEWICSRPGHCACVVVGGAIEALEAKPGHFNLVLQKRKGFIKQALIHGASLVPVFSFGEVDIYDQVPNPEGSFLKRLQEFLAHKIFGFSLPVVIGRGVFNYSLGFMPYRKPINTIVGKPIEVVKTPDPTHEEVNSLHARYLEALTELFEENKAKYGVEESKHINFVG